MVDIETTGLSLQYDEIIEIAAIKYRAGVKVDQFSTLVKPEYEIDEYITELTGITLEDFIHSYRKSNSHKGISAREITTEKTEFDEAHPLFEKVCVFTGTLEKMQLVVDLGGIPGDRTCPVASKRPARESSIIFIK